MKKASVPSKKANRKQPSAAGRPRKRPAIASALDKLGDIEPDSPKATALIAMLRSWLDDESGYDEQTWPKLTKALDAERKRVGARRLFDD